MMREQRKDMIGIVEETNRGALRGTYRSGDVLAGTSWLGGPAAGQRSPRSGSAVLERGSAGVRRA
jgi:hypothetical protein